MATIESINSLLTVAARLIDSAAKKIRDAPFEPVSENIEHMGRALASIFEVQHQIYALRPQLMPEYLEEPSEFSEASKALTETMFRATELEREGNAEGAITEYEEFLRVELSELHREIAVGEIERLRANGSP